MSNKAENTYLVDFNWSQDPTNIIGKFEVSPLPNSQGIWNVVKSNPDKFQFGFSFTEDEKTGEKELVGISLINIMPNQKFRDIPYNKKPSVEG